ncbi:unnamed protein product [Triticum turgidum subsp. durum]|uniref:Uncharacterized protein n=1 Tax=Triticum turgidum subsp. durum TaxID=4567 RepID=A0A9R0T7P4_TRITD|nr:unnamed protein product [Triticum turgidum subsp. durum]
MEGRVAGDVELDSAVFQVTLTKNRYEAIACNGESAESVASGPFDQLVLHLEDAKNFQSRSSSGSFKLLLIGDAKGSTWFTKSTLERFLHIINSPDASKTANGILQEMSQLEETRKFHDYLQSKEQQNLMGGALTGTFKESFASSIVLCTRKPSQPFSVYGCMQYGFCLLFMKPI